MFFGRMPERVLSAVARRFQGISSAQILLRAARDSPRVLCYQGARNTLLINSMYVCMYVWSSHIAEYGSTG